MNNRLRVVRAEKRVSQFRLRLETGINATKISFIENDLIDASQDEKEKIGRALGVNVTEIFGDEKVPVVPEKNSGAQGSLSTDK